MSKNLYIIGTCHLDFHGPEKLNKLLNELQPDLIAVEGLEDDTNRRIKWDLDKILLDIKNKIPDMTEIQLEITEKILKVFGSIIGYEVTEVKKYTQNNKIPIIYVDKDCIDSETVNTTLYNVYLDGYVALFNNLYSDFDCKDYELTLNLFIRHISGLFRLFRSVYSFMSSDEVYKREEREEYMFNKIKELLVSGPSNIVLICGASHMDSLNGMFQSPDYREYKIKTYDLIFA